MGNTSVIIDKNISSVGWYIGTYLARFIEIKDEFNDNPEARFATWENTVFIKALILEEAFEKVEKISVEHAEPFKGKGTGAPFRWKYLGIINLLPSYKKLEDDSELT